MGVRDRSTQTSLRARYQLANVSNQPIFSLEFFDTQPYPAAQKRLEPNQLG